MTSIVEFHNSYIPEPNSGCWIWEKSLNNRGYGLLQRGGYRGYAHRFSYSHFIGNIPKGMFVCHQCDLRCCVNPDHLWIGTHIDNMNDCLAKGRHVSQSYNANQARGECIGQSKLTSKEVLEIRAIGMSLSQRKIAIAYGVTKNAIKLVLQRKTWNHI